MGKFLESTFFSDKIRGLVTLFLLVLIAGFLLFQTIFPHKPTLDQETMQSLQNVTEVLRKAAVNLESAGQSQAELNETLKRQLGDLDTARNKGYEELLEKYGLDVDLPTTPGDGLINRMQPRNNDLRGKPVPPGSSPTGADQHLQSPTPGHQEKADPGHTGGQER
jgi:hypothetical protein